MTEEAFRRVHLIVAFGMEEVQGPADDMNGIPLNVATPFSSV